MKTITVMRDGRPATSEELRAAVEGRPLPPVPGSPTLREQLAAALDEVARLKSMARTPRAPIRGALGGIIQDLREDQGIRLRELALKSGVAAGLLSKLERCADANLTFHNLVKIAQGLKTPVSAIIARWESENDPSAPDTRP